MDIATSVLRTGAETIERFAFAADKTFEASLLMTAKSAVRHVISITPPASADNIAGGLDSGSEAKARGMNAIRRDLNNAFIGVRIKHKRKERISGADLVRIHRFLLSRKRPGAPMRRDTAQPYYVDIRKLRALETKQRASVGKLAAGWLPAARALGAKAPAWIARHSGRGTIQIATGGKTLAVRISNNPSPYAPKWVAPETQRRADKATVYALNGLQRQMPYLLRTDARKAGMFLF